MLKIKSNTKIAYLLTMGFKEERLEDIDDCIFFIFKDTEEIREQIDIFKDVVSNKDFGYIYWIDYKKYMNMNKYVRDRIREFRKK